MLLDKEPHPLYSASFERPGHIEYQHPKRGQTNVQLINLRIPIAIILNIHCFMYKCAEGIICPNNLNAPSYDLHFTEGMDQALANLAQLEQSF